MRWRHLLWPRLDRPAPQPGLYHYALQRPDGRSRVHLRVEKDGSGLMLVDATVAVRMNASAMAIARAILDGKSLDATRRELRRTFRSVPTAQVAEDYAKIERLLSAAREPGERLPVAGVRIARGRAVLDGGLRPLPRRPGPDLPVPERLPPLLRRAPARPAGALPRRVAHRAAAALGRRRAARLLHRRRGHALRVPGGAGRDGRGPRAGDGPADERSTAERPRLRARADGRRPRPRADNGRVAP